MIRMIGLDLDGTLLTRRKSLTEGNKAALEAAAGRGVHIVPVTGRPLSGLPGQILDLPFIRYIITSNGAVITDRKQGKAIRERCMSVQTAEEALRAAEGAYRQVLPSLAKRGNGNGRRAAVIGGGPAGLAAAAFLSREGVPVTVFEKREKPGGIVRFAIPAFRIGELPYHFPGNPRPPAITGQFIDCAVVVREFHFCSMILHS